MCSLASSLLSFACFCTSWKWNRSAVLFCTLLSHTSCSGVLSEASLSPYFVFHLLFSGSVVSDSSRPRELQRAGLLCPPLSARVCSNSSPLSQWCLQPPHLLSPLLLLPSNFSSIRVFSNLLIVIWYSIVKFIMNYLPTLLLMDFVVLSRYFLLSQIRLCEYSFLCLWMYRCKSISGYIFRSRIVESHGKSSTSSENKNCLQKCYITFFHILSLT